MSKIEAWTPFGSGIYFVSCDTGKASIDFFDLNTKQTRTIYVSDRGVPVWMGSISVSSDGRWLLFPQLDQQSSDLMLVENWH
jgi:Tol biopolymer transport system component